MSKHMPPVPPEQQTPHGGTPRVQAQDAMDKDERARELAHQGQQGNIKQNTSRQGNLQDR